MNYNKNLSLDMKVSYITKNEYNYFLNKKGVVGVALGYKITNGFSTFKKCIKVFVEKKVPLNILSRENIIPKCYKGVMTDVIESGIFRFNSLTSRVRPVINGYSVGNISSTLSGTCGCLVHDKYLYILSCNHILAMNNKAKKESVILQPGVQDGGTLKKDVIGHLNRFVPIKFERGPIIPENLVDCALCKVISRSFVSPDIAFVGIPKGVSEAQLDENVQKVGRTSELTYGKITDLYGSMSIVTDEGERALFQDQIITSKMCYSGDSGSLLLNNKMKAVGLIMGSGPRRSLSNPIDEVLKKLKVELVTK